MLGAPDGSTIFRPVVPNQAVATLLLIENSQEMVSIWSDLRDHHLPTLIGTMRIANPVAPIKILMLASSPVDEHTSTASAPREYYELPEVQFNFHPHNRFSAATISRGIDLLASTGRAEPTARHIVIVAASTPAEDPMPELGNLAPDGWSSWHLLAQKMAQAEIHCHMILNPNQNMNAFTELFYETLRLQNFEEVAPWFQTDENFVFHLSARPISYPKSASSVPCTSSFTAFPPPSLQRNYSFPPDVSTSSLVDDMSSSSAAVPSESQVDTSPSLVARLQQAHGLTKKKIYAAKPNRQPFFRDERVRDKYHPHSRTRALPPWPRRGSRMSSPETDTPLPSPTSMSTLAPRSPVLSYPDFDQFQPSMPPPSITPSVDGSYASGPRLDPVGMDALRPSDGKGRLIEPTWPENQYHPGAPPLSPTSQLHMPFHDDGMGGENVRVSIAAKAHHLSSAHPSSGGLPSYKPPLLPGPTIGHSQQQPPAGVRRSSNAANTEPTLNFSLSQLAAASSMDDGDRPFIFNAEYEAATAARMEEVLQASPSLRFSIPVSIERTLASAAPVPNPQAFYPPPTMRPQQPVASSSSSSSSSAAAVGSLYGRNPHSNKTMAQVGAHPPTSPQENMPGTYAFGGSSSLTGWAG